MLCASLVVPLFYSYPSCHCSVSTKLNLELLKTETDRRGKELTLVALHYPLVASWLKRVWESVSKLVAFTHT